MRKARVVANGTAKRRRCTRAVGAAVSLAAGLFAGPVTASPLAPTPILVRYEGPDDCASADALLEAVKRVAPNVRGADAAEPARVVDVAIETLPDSGRARGRLTVSGRGVRSIDAASCAEVSGLLAFAAALAIEEDRDAVTPPTASPATDDAPIVPVARASEASPASIATLDGRARNDIALSTNLSFVADADGTGMAIGAGALFRHRSFVVGAIGAHVIRSSSVLWSGGVAAGLGAKPSPWLRIDVLGSIGIDSHTMASPPDESGDADARALLPVIGARTRACVDVSNVLLGLEASAETNLWSVSRTSTLFPGAAGSPENRRGTFSIGGPRVALGLVLGIRFDP